MRAWMMLLLVAPACSPPDTATDTDTTTATTETTATTATTADTAVPMVLIHHAVFESDRGCWAVRDLPRPEAFWGEYIDNHCQARVTIPGAFLSDPDGLCVGFYGPFEGNCAVEDPWLRDCSESNEPTCCTTLRYMPTCDPGAYQP